ncbi:MAG TPA: hypothetical protein VES40_11610 [Ilumatobacteraceae bacterium]|nr:hypothetical protein [Ilumatobacteraceae bacterium]
MTSHSTEPVADGALHRRLGIEAFNATWELIDGRDYAPADVDELLARAYASAYHWKRASDRGPENDARASWLLSRCHVVLGHGDLALHHADRCTAVVAEAGLVDFDLGYAHEARARALACLGRLDEAGEEFAAARVVDVADDEDRELFEGDLAAEPWFGLDRAG